MGYWPFVKTSNKIYDCNVLCRTLGMCEITENFLESFHIPLVSRVSPATVHHLPNFAREHLGLKCDETEWCHLMHGFWIHCEVESPAVNSHCSRKVLPVLLQRVTFCFCSCLCRLLEIPRESEWESLMSQVFG